MGVLKWNTPTVTSILSASDLQGLANGSAALTSAYDNSAVLDLNAELLAAIRYNSGPPSAGAKIADVYLEPAIDGTNYPSVGSSIPAKSLWVAALESRAPSTSAVEYLPAVGISIPPGLWKIRLVNVSTVSFHSSDTNMFLKIRTYGLQY